MRTAYARFGTHEAREADVQAASHQVAAPVAPEPQVLADLCLCERARAELALLGLSVQQLDPENLPANGVAIVRGAEAAERFAREHIKLAVVGVVGTEELGFASRAIADLVLLDWIPGELAARVRRLLAQDAPGFRVHLLARAVEFAGDIIELGTTQAVLQYVNPAYKEVLGYAPHEAEGKTPGQLVRSSAHTPEFFRQLDATLKAGKTWKGRLTSVRRDGQHVHLDTTVAPVADREGHITHHVAVKRDVTLRVQREAEMAQANRELRVARDDALAANRAKSEFLANMSHELRTPLNAVIGYSEILIEDAEEEGNLTLLADLRKIRNSGLSLLELLNDVLDMSKIESGRVELETSPCRLSEVLLEVQETVSVLAERQNNQLLIEPQESGVQLVTDRLKLRQILVNLLTNANKFTRGGQVRVRARCAEPGWVSVEVQDTGIGMTPLQCEKVFQPFVQADASTTRRYGGTGLGLAISQRFAELLGGRIELTSKVGEGSTFRLVLPLAPTFRPA